MKKILIIGGGGYVGTVLAAHLLQSGYKVSILDNFVYDNEFASLSLLSNPNYELVNGDAGDERILNKVSNDVSHVILLAGLVGDPITKSYPNASADINELMVAKCFDYFNNKGVDKLIFISTCSNYGLIKENELAHEDFELSPLSLYAKAKVKNELILLSKKDTVDYTGVVLRFATAFGLSPRMRFDLSVSEFVRDVFFGEELLVYDEHTWRPYCHVKDFSRLLQMIIEAPNEKVAFQVFNAGGDMNNYTKKMIVDEILKEIPNGKVRYGSNGSDPRNYKVSFEKVKNVLGFEPKHSISDGIKELIEAFKAGAFQDVFVNKNRYGNYKINYKIQD